MLTITEDLMLLAVHDEKGSLIFGASSNLPFGLAGAIMMDLHNLGKIKLSGNNIEIVDYSPTNVEYLDVVLVKLKNHAKQKEVSYWVENLGNNSGEIRKQILDSLCQKGVLKKEEQKFLWLIEFDRYPTLNPIPELETRKTLHDVILRGQEPDHRTLTLIGLINVCNLINELFDKEHRKTAKESIEKLVARDNMSGEVGIIINNILLSIGRIVVSSSSTATSPSL